VIRPRLYQPKPETLTASLLDLFRAIDVMHVQGRAETIDVDPRTVKLCCRRLLPVWT
jgi:NADH dehydrogenase